MIAKRMPLGKTCAQMESCTVAECGRNMCCVVRFKVLRLRLCKRHEGIGYGSTVDGFLEYDVASIFLCFCLLQVLVLYLVDIST